jgi:hypothetical protein
VHPDIKCPTVAVIKDLPIEMVARYEMGFSDFPFYILSSLFALYTSSKFARLENKENSHNMTTLNGT